MGTCRILLLSAVVAVALFHVCHGDRSGDCAEVGVARTGGQLLYTTYEEIKPKMLEKWSQEDKSKTPKYTNFSQSLKNLTRGADLLEEMSKAMLEQIRKTRIGRRCKRDWLLSGIERHTTPLINLDEQLAKDLKIIRSFECQVNSPYPMVDGSCIHEQSADIGARESKLLRLQPTVGGKDGFSLRGSVSDDKELPSARAVSSLIRKHMTKPKVTSLFTALSHFMQMDIFSIAKSPYSEGVDCCSEPEHEDCASIPVPEDDPLHASLKCINYRRNAKAQAILGHREAYSLVSSYLDATPLYGSTNSEALKLKSKYFGYLRGADRHENGEGDCKAPDSFTNCHKNDEDDEDVKIPAGIRALFLLEHNRISDKLSALNPHFDDSILYNEARRVVIAEYNAIVYGQYVQALMGDAAVKKFLLHNDIKERDPKYIPEIMPGVLSIFAMGAFRNPAMLTEWESDEPGRDEMIGSLHYDTLRDHPYQDVLAVDVQMARDHGVTGYIHWRRFCDPGLKLDSWEDFKQIFADDIVEALEKHYDGEMDDIDVMVALLEPPVEGAVAGVTFNCILGDQFARLRTGNKMYWEHEGAQFTEGQIDTIRTNSSLASLVCNNFPVDSLPTNPLLPESEQNPLVKCSDVKPFDMTHWRDTSLIDFMKNPQNKAYPGPPSFKSTDTEETEKSSEDSSKDAGKEQSSEDAGKLSSDEKDDDAVASTPDVTVSTSSSSSSGGPQADQVADGNPTSSVLGGGTVTEKLTLTAAAADKDEL